MGTAQGTFGVDCIGSRRLPGDNHDRRRNPQVDEFARFPKLVLNQRAPAHEAAIWSGLTKLCTSAAETRIGAEHADQKARPRVTIEQPCASIQLRGGSLRRKRAGRGRRGLTPPTNRWRHPPVVDETPPPPT